MRRTLAGLAGLSMVAAGALLALPSAANAEFAPRNEGITDSALTKSGAGAFKDLRITVGQTQNLVNQVVLITWEGGTPTVPEFTEYWTNYLQIMQCWGGTPEEGPPREQCQYGSQKGSGGGQNAASRQLNQGTAVDPNETKYEEYLDGRNSYVPFVSFTGKTTTGNISEFFDRQTSNEVNYARTRPDGTGQDYFEVQTGVEAPGLGCGQTRDGETPLCWLVVVPRGETEVDGTARGDTGSNILDTTPLSQSNWDNRIVFPLEFQPVGANCAIGSDETPLLGSDRVAEAIVRWQPSLCQLAGNNYSFTVLPDAGARSKLVGDRSDLVFVTYPVPKDQVPPTRPITYAPIALSGITIAFNLESQSSTLAPREVRVRDGQRLGNIKLNQRLVAKLLTQSYRYDTAPVAENIPDNPWDLAQDPEFLDLNPQFKELLFPAVGHMVTIAGQSDTARLVWEWIVADKDARAFLEGKADPWGMKINPLYKKGVYPREDFPRTDNQCVQRSNTVVAVCTFDLFPYAGDLYAAARAGSRGDTMSRGVYDPTAIPPGYKRTPAQSPGKRAMIVITDTPLIDRFALTAAALRNAAGEYVLPTESAMRIAAAKSVRLEGTPVAQPDAGAKTKGAYPLTSYTYAATTPATLTETQAEAYAQLLDYAAGAGQQLGNEMGQLPFGYVPLNAAELKEVRSAATTIVKNAGKEVKVDDTTETPDPSTDTTDSTDSTTDTTTDTTYTDTTYTDTTYTDTSYTDTTYTDTSSSTTSTSTTDVTTDGGTSEVTTETTTDQVLQETTAETVTTDTSAVAAVEAIPTPESPVGWIRYVAVMLLIAGGLATVAGALLAQRLVKGP
jgi:hypothetical protein